MKSLIMFFVLFFSQVVFAQPDYLKDGTITVTLKDGKQYTFSTNEYMVVNRAASAQLQQQRLAEQESTCCEAVEKAVAEADKPWRATVHAGVGSDGHSVKGDNNTVEVSERRAFVYGLSLGRKVYRDLSVTGTVLSNQTYTLGVGLDFK